MVIVDCLQERVKILFSNFSYPVIYNNHWHHDGGPQKRRRNKKIQQGEILMLEAIRLIAERKISEAIRKGLLDTQGWRNRPLPMTCDNLVPEELRMAHKILKNAGYLPPEIEAKKEIQQIEELLASCEDECTRVKRIKKLNFLVQKLNIMKGDSVNIESQEEYYRKIVERISIGKRNTE
jgi:hypothetical protein